MPTGSTTPRARRFGPLTLSFSRRKATARSANGGREASRELAGGSGGSEANREHASGSGGESASERACVVSLLAQHSKVELLTERDLLLDAIAEAAAAGVTADEMIRARDKLHAIELALAEQHALSSQAGDAEGAERRRQAASQLQAASELMQSDSSAASLLVAAIEEAELAQVATELIEDARRHLRSEPLCESVHDGYFTYTELSDATGGFAAENVLGKGGGSTVFSGILSSGTHVAVKRLDQAAELARLFGVSLEEQISNELTLLSKSGSAHPNIVPLIGQSDDGPSRCLVYMRMSGGCLEERLRIALRTRPAPCDVLRGARRVSIIADIAQGLAHLHTKLAIIHRDLNSSNIMLDDQLNARIGDFGLCCKVGAHPAQAGEHLQGTPLYMVCYSSHPHVNSLVSQFLV